MKAVARRTREGSYRHDIVVREHFLGADEPLDTGGTDSAPCPQELLAASLASCTAITMEMYARRKDWDIGAVEVSCEFTPAERGAPTKFEIVVTLPDTLPDDQIEKLQVIAAKCPVHRTLEGEVTFVERFEVARGAAAA